MTRKSGAAHDLDKLSFESNANNYLESKQLISQSQLELLRDTVGSSLLGKGDTLSAPLAPDSTIPSVIIADSGVLSHQLASESVYITPTYHVLIVDDVALNRKMLGRTLKAAGHTFDCVEDGKAAYDLIVSQHLAGRVEYDVVLMDFVMPVMDGPTATKKLRDAGVVVPIIGVTGNGMQYDVDWFIDHGATAVLLKPFDISKFQRIMEEND